MERYYVRTMAYRRHLADEEELQHTEVGGGASLPVVLVFVQEQVVPVVPVVLVLMNEQLQPWARALLDSWRTSRVTLTAPQLVPG